jgi:hypothetical protein
VKRARFEFWDSTGSAIAAKTAANEGSTSARPLLFRKKNAGGHAFRAFTVIRGYLGAFTTAPFCPSPCSVQ